MKRYILLLLINIFLPHTFVYGNPFEEYYPKQTSAIMNFNLNDLKEYFSIAKNSMMDKTYQEVIARIYKKLSLDMNKDLKEITINFVKVKMGFLKVENNIPLIFVSGNFKNQDNRSFIKSLIKEYTNEDSEEKKVIINGKEKFIYIGGKFEFSLLDDSLLMIGIKGLNELINNQNITFRKANQNLIDLSKNIRSYVYIDKSYFYRLYLIPDLLGDTNNTESIAIYFKNESINFEINIDDIKIVEEKVNNYKNRIKSFLINYANIFKQETDYLRNKSLEDFNLIAETMYYNALFKKIIDSITFSTEEKNIILSVPLDYNMKLQSIGYFVSKLISYINQSKQNFAIQSCMANQQLLSKAINAYNHNDNSNLHYDFSFNKDKDEDDEHYNSYTFKRIKEKVLKPNKTGKTTMILDIPNLVENDCLVIEPMQVDPDCDYCVYKEKFSNEYSVLCLKHTFLLQKQIEPFGKVFVKSTILPVLDNRINNKFSKKHFINSRSCYLNQITLSKAIEKYNRTHDKKMTSLDEDTLLNEHCLDIKPKKLEVNCEYYSEGDLSTNDGYISCKLHGPESQPIKEKETNIMFPQKPNIIIHNNSEKTCFSNIRVITGAIEMFNMDIPDNSPKRITSKIDFQALINGHYLKKEPDKPTSECEYYIEGNITKDGKVVCKKHGSIKK